MIPRNSSHTTAFVIAVLVPLAVAAGPDYNHDIRPILSNNCFACHGPDEAQRKASLRLDLPEDAAGVLSPGDRAQSKLFARVSHPNPADRMPPTESGKTLAAEQIELIGDWIDAGAPYDQHWAFIKPTRPQPPAVKNAAWPRNPIDHFILARLEARDIVPSPEADRRTLIRRVFLDLIGLPPSIEEVNAYLLDNAPGAYERHVDRLLASPHFGERWGRHWLDAARYADSNGYSIDSPRSIWKYRDWVIDAFNRDLPFDQFTVEQFAGDLLPNATPEQKIATGFHRNTMINEEGGIDPEEFRIEAVINRVNTTGTVYLGLTMACAQCHTHKYDPITQREYFSFFAFFNNDDDRSLEVPTDEERAARDAHRAKIREATRELNAYFDTVRATKLLPWETALTEDVRHELADSVRAALALPPWERTPDETRLVEDAFKEDDPEYQERLGTIERLNRSTPRITSSLVLAARNAPRETNLHIAGDFTRKGEPVDPAVPAILHPLPDSSDPPNRLDLAQWLVDPENPLTSRVTVNRFWQRLFGKGIVETENDFGAQGTAPSHPELLDWLAVEFIESGWRVKHMLRLMVTSAAYRQSAYARPGIDAMDPANRLLARQTRLRLDAEIIRDNALAVSGLLHPEIGGPSVFPPQPDGVMTLGQQRRAWNVSQGFDRYRRGMYTFFWRATPHPTLTVFDAPDALEACTRRNRANTPLQALTLLNDEAFVEFAHALAGRILDEVPEDRRIDHLFQLTLARAPTQDERAIIRQLLQIHPGAPKAAWTAAARAILNTDEFITRE